MDVCLVIKQRLDELGFEQRDLAVAAEVTESYVSQLLTRKKLPPAPERTDIYERTRPWIDKYGGWAILVLSAIPNPVFDVAGIAAGIAKMPLKTFLSL